MWYHNLYFLNCAAKDGATTPGLFANWSYNNIGTAWHGDYHMNYNTQQPFWATFSSNHLDKNLPYVNLIEKLMPVSKSWAKEYYENIKIEQLEIPVGKYKFDDYEIPNEAMGIYIHINPRSLKKAMQDVAIELTRKGFDGEIVNPVDFSLTAIQKRASNRRFHIYDFDSVEVSDVLKEIIDNDIVNLDCLSLIKTRGGFHLLLDYAKVNVKYKNFYNKMAKLNGLDGNASGDCLTPVVGCCQGGFTIVSTHNALEEGVLSSSDDNIPQLSKRGKVEAIKFAKGESRRYG
jgi:hypothetical protein